MNKLNQGEHKKMSPVQKWLFLALNASLPWSIFIGLLISTGPIYFGNKLITNLQENYKARAEKIVNKYSNVSYECGDIGSFTQYICQDITEIVMRDDRDINIANIYKTSIVDNKIETSINNSEIEQIKTIFDNFIKQYPDNFIGELKVTGGIKKIDFNNPESITKGALNSDLESVLLVKELESHIPILKDKIKARSKQEFLSEKDKNMFLNDLKTLGYSGVFDVDSITNFFLYTHTKFESEKNQELHSELFKKYFGEIRLNFHGEKIMGTYKGNSLTSPLYALIISLFTILLYTSIFFPISGRKKIKKKFVKAEYGKIPNGVSSKEEGEEINRYREVLGLQSFNEAVKMFNQLGSISNGKIIRKKGSNWLVLLKKNSNFRVNRKNSVLFVIPKIDPKCYKRI